MKNTNTEQEEIEKLKEKFEKEIESASLDDFIRFAELLRQGKISLQQADQ